MRFLAQPTNHNDNEMPFLASLSLLYMYVYLFVNLLYIKKVERVYKTDYRTKEGKLMFFLAPQIRPARNSVLRCPCQSVLSRGQLPAKIVGKSVYVYKVRIKGVGLYKFFLCWLVCTNVKTSMASL